MIYIEGILRELIRVINIVFGDLLYIFALIFSVYVISRIFIISFYLRYKSIISSSNIGIIESRLEVMKNFYFTKKGKVIDVFKCINIIALIYLALNFNLKLFIITFILNIVGVIYTSTHYNKELKKIISNLNN